MWASAPTECLRIGFRRGRRPRRPASVTRGAVRCRRADRGVRPYGSAIRGAMGGRPQGSPLRKRYKRHGAKRNPPVTAAPCQPPLGKGAEGTGVTDCHSQCTHWLRNDRAGVPGSVEYPPRQCAHWFRNDTLQEMLWLSDGGMLFRSRSSGRGFL